MKLPQGLLLPEPVKGLSTEDESDARIVQAGLFGRPLAPSDQRMRFRSGAHLGIRLDRDDVHSAIGEQPRADAGTGADVGRDERRGGW